MIAKMSWQEVVMLLRLSGSVSGDKVVKVIKVETNTSTERAVKLAVKSELVSPEGVAALHPKQLESLTMFYGYVIEDFLAHSSNLFLSKALDAARKEEREACLAILKRYGMDADVTAVEIRARGGK